MDAIEILNQLEKNPSADDMRLLLAEKINDMILHDFQSLVQLLYRIDVNEKQLRKFLSDNKETNAGLIIADMMIKRQLEKKEMRAKFRQNEKDIPDDEKW